MWGGGDKRLYEVFALFGIVSYSGHCTLTSMGFIRYRFKWYYNTCDNYSHTQFIRNPLGPTRE